MIVYEERDHFVFIKLDRAEKMNALTREMLDELREYFETLGARQDMEVRALILTGAGEQAFSAGTDINELAALDVEGARQASLRGQRLCEAIERCPVPVIAAINGLAAGGGCEIALASHIRIASSKARFSLPETKLGMIPAYGGTQRLARDIGTSRALELMLAGVEISAQEALRIGLVNRVVEPSKLLPEAEALARQISQLAPLAVRACLEAVMRGIDLTLDEGLALEADLFSKLFATEDVREGTSAFLEKRAPIFKGK